MTNFIAKLQRPIATNDPKPKVLIYNQDRSFYKEMSFTEEALNRHFKNAFKIYAEVAVRIDSTGRIDLKVIQILPDQDW